MIELLSPVGDFECLKAAVQNGANAVYFGASLFNARAFASNFDDENLKLAINYAKIRGVKTHLTLNICLKEKEVEDAFYLAKKAYEFGIDAIIVQDFGIAKLLIENFPDLEIHASTQMTIHNLEGALLLENLHFKRAVLARELPLEEIKYICENSNIEIETFIHGALCISYSGQCLLSSMIGGRSGNRGKCAQPCRLPYELIQKSSSDKEIVLDNGYLLSPRDLCSLEVLPELIKTGVNSLKIEGRMKSPEYVATVTRIYRKYIDLSYKYINHEVDSYKVNEQDKLDLMQVFNRGGFSKGHLNSKENRELIFKEKPNNMGIPLGKVLKFNPTKGHITCKLSHQISIGDNISFDKENTKYTVSEIMKNNQNLKNANCDEIVTLGRMKGNIKKGDNIYKISSNDLTNLALESYNKENINIQIESTIFIKDRQKIEVNSFIPQFNIHNNYIYEYIPEKAQKAPITTEKIKEQFNKTGNSIFRFSKLDINLDNGLFIPVSILNDVRRNCLENIETEIYNLFKRKSNASFKNDEINNNLNVIPKNRTSISILLNIINPEYDYSRLKNIDKFYIPLKYFYDIKYQNILNEISKISKIYVYLPSILIKRYIDIFKSNISKIKNFKISGFVISNLSQLRLLQNIGLDNLEIIGNYTLNIYNSYTANNLMKLGISLFTVSPELDKDSIIDFCCKFKGHKEMIVYGKIPVMTMNYCPLGKSNKCYSDCYKKCLTNNKYFLKDRLGLTFRLIPDNTQTVSTLYNSKIISINYNEFNINSVRIDILDENIDKINEIVLNIFNR